MSVLLINLPKIAYEYSWRKQTKKQQILLLTQLFSQWIQVHL